ncbi:hypothetical protein ANN_01255 [Periplaneta americana]|uniref:Uncharacterized protein n=1 Tax=Periplaneta americana TaxID=6978 RepID=A0ABQ8TT59_PERAM|nr:hypothetical protein ANN_01255 [Periplaneta americana]
MSPGSSTESYPAFARIGLRENPGKNLNQNRYTDFTKLYVMLSGAGNGYGSSGKLLSPSDSSRHHIKILGSTKENDFICKTTHTRKRTVLTEDKLNKIGAHIERSPTKSLPKLAQQVGVSVSSARKATKLLKVKPYKCTRVHCLQQGHPAALVRYSNSENGTFLKYFFDLPFSNPEDIDDCLTEDIMSILPGGEKNCNVH